MPPEATSKHLRSATELTLVAKVLPGLVPVRETRSYATRIGILLRVLYTIRQKAIEASRLGVPHAGPLERLQALHFVRWSLLDRGSKLLLAVSFDGPWEPYMRRIVDVAGPLLDVILCSCEGYDAHASDRGHEGFVAWVREHQVESQFFHADSPETSADDLRFLKLLDAHQRRESDLARFDEAAARLRVPEFGRDPGADPNLPDAHREQLLRVQLDALDALYRLRELFPDDVARDPTRGHLHLLRTAHLILPGFERLAVPAPWSEVHERALAWYHRLEPRTRPSRPTRPDPDRSQVQGNILEPYTGMTHGCLVLLRIADAARAKPFLDALASRVTVASTPPGGPTLNLAFSFRGLQALGLPADELRRLPKEFREGMEARAGFLGDVGPNHPDHWERPARLRDGLPLDLSTVDLVALLQRRKDAGDDGDHAWSGSHPLYDEVMRLGQDSGLELLAVEVLRREPPENGYAREHFGFRDGISQPQPGGLPGRRDSVPMGEVLLGHPNERGDSGEPPLDFLQDGSFLVVRKLEQDVGRFRGILEQHSPRAAEQERLAARMMGRYRDGRPLVDDGLPTDANDFVFDREGETPCPPAAHIRLANPRTPRPAGSLAGTRPAPIPRIVRRGFSYGRRYAPDTAAERRGLFFMAYNASIAEQYEVIQRWLCGGNSTGLPTAEADPFLGQAPPGSSDRTFRSLVGSRVERVSLGHRPLVSLRWGIYLFVPSTRAIRQLAARMSVLPRLPAGDPRRGEEILHGLETLHRLEKLRSPQQADAKLRTAWKLLIEDVGSVEQARDMWAAVRARGGVLRTPYGVLLGSADHVMRAFRDHRSFSVREYWDRMRRSLGQLYLGMDPDPQATRDPDPAAQVLDAAYHRARERDRYARESAEANRFIEGIRGADAFVAARERTRERLEVLTRHGAGDRVVIDLRSLVGDVLAGLSRDWFALPDGERMLVGGPAPEDPATGPPHCPDDFLATARYIFSPHPTPFVVEEGRARGQALRAAAEAYVRDVFSGRREPPVGSLFEQLRRGLPHAPSEDDVDVVARTLVGSVHGFVGPCYGSLVSVLHLWISSRQLWRRQSALAWEQENQPPHHAFCALASALIATLQLRPLPYVLHRTVVRRTQLERSPESGAEACDFELQAGERVVLGLLSATRERASIDPEVLFGGHRGGADAPTHACPGQQLAMGVMLGFLWSLLEHGPWESPGALLLETPTRIDHAWKG